MHGFGNIGKSMATIANGFGMDVYAFDPHSNSTQNNENNVTKCSSVDEMYQLCDIVSINIPANEKTIGSINYDLLSKTNENVLVINSARKELINEEDLLRIMEERDGFMYTSDFAPSSKDYMTDKFPMRTLFTTKKMGLFGNSSHLILGFLFDYSQGRKLERVDIKRPLL